MKNNNSKSITRRRVHIKLLDHNKVQITSRLIQKTFNLDSLRKSGHMVDLVFLKKIDRSNNFYLEVTSGTGEVDDPYNLEVHAHEKEGYAILWPTVVAEFSIRTNVEQTIEVTLVE